MYMAELLVLFHGQDIYHWRAFLRKYLKPPGRPRALFGNRFFSVPLLKEGAPHSGHSSQPVLRAHGGDENHLWPSAARFTSWL